MGNNASSISKGRSSLSRRNSGAKNYSVNHVEYANAQGGTTGSAPIKIKRISGDNKPRTDQRRTSSVSSEQQQEQPLDPPSYVSSFYPPEKSKKSKVQSPNIFLDNLVDHDYFGPTATNSSTSPTDVKEEGESSNTSSTKHERTNVVRNGMSGPYSFDDDDDDGYAGIDEDLISGATEDHELRKEVLIKFENTKGELKPEDAVYVVGSFNQWTKKIPLEPIVEDGHLPYFQTSIVLPYGVYKLKFIVNNQIRYSDRIPMATDKMGNVVNWFEVDGIPGEVFEAGITETNRILNNKLKSSMSFLNQSQSEFNSSGHLVTSGPQTPSTEKVPLEKVEYSQEIPTIFQTASASQQDEFLPADEEFLHKHPIPELPVYLNNSYLNKHFNKHHDNSSSENNSRLPTKTEANGLNSHIMPHVNLNHLLTSNIKNNTLSVACTTRYVGKFMTKIMYSPSEYDL